MSLKPARDPFGDSAPKTSSPIMIVFKIPLSNIIVFQKRGNKLISLKESTNKIYAGQHWAKRKEYKDRFTGHAARFCKLAEPIRTWPVSIRYRFVFETRALDTTNCSYLVKIAEDSLRAFQILPDDSPKYVAESIIEVIEKPRPP